ncbi:MULTISPECIES: hypothetical protein [Mycolicibacterium]|jgi:hypothetical protein|uniref:Uncharacterized protein n=1 Tax=Mycolicibacterium fortuitum TaxID=1766 RepID=A0AAE4VGP1_MYCFO|nr:MULTISPECIES: hypothetical protein [Mycolicibacterium]MDV7194348.1 hypothetical protein [Mycolicibacterium fortuitum]MDV7294233.1 hypothetical protein [Mycolicibacterium fortuitum]MDV7301346.1 hypothetical protein [Mycolicibacterium fortuitum]MDV7323148.1 hypothetical protein [Mycolicibacterium fortuitum]MDV7363602.1 hypothetical protein [Mycolicibacterium fortuitum]
MTEHSDSPSNKAAERWQPHPIALVGGAAVAVAVGVVAGVAITTGASDDHPAAMTATTTVTETVVSTVTETPDTSVNPQTPTPAPALSTTIPGEGGTYIVGIDVQPGMYRAQPSRNTASCSWKRLSDVGDPNSIIMINNSDGPTYVRIEPTDAAFMTQFCTTWQRID